MSYQLKQKFIKQIQQLINQANEAHLKGDTKKSQDLTEYASQLQLHFEEMVQEGI